jgi:hypothetical protein
MSADEVAALLDRLGVAGAHADADELLAEIARHFAPVDAALATFLSRALNGETFESESGGGARFVSCWSSIDLIASWSWEEDHAGDEYVSRLVPFADDEGDFLFLVDPTNRIGFGATAVYSVEKGARSIGALDLIARTVEDFLRIYTDGRPAVDRQVLELRDEETAARALPLVLGDGTRLAPEAVSAPRYHLGADVLRAVDLTGPLAIADHTFQPGPASAWRREPDLAFFASGAVERGVSAGGSIDGFRIRPGSTVSWSQDGALVMFTPDRDVTVNGVPCRAGETVVRNRAAFFFTPAVDTDYRGFPCKAGEKVDDYGSGLGLHFTTSRAYLVGGRTVPPDVRVTVMDDGGARFDLTAPMILDGRALAPGTHVWFSGAGEVREIYEPAR